MVPYPNHKTEAERLEEAAEAAFADGDHEHARELRRRATAARRNDRERAAGVAPLWADAR